MRKFARLGLSFALLIIAMSTQSNEKITTGEPVTTPSNGDFSAMLERLDSIYLSGSLQTYISEAIALSNEPGITFFQQEQVAENLLWDCAYVSDLDCVRMVLEWRIQVFRYPDDLDQLVEADFEERKKVYSIWLRALDAKDEQGLAEILEDKTQLLDYSRERNLYVANKLWTHLAIQVGDAKEAEKGVDRVLAMLISLRDSPLPKWRLIREYLSVIRLVGPSEHAKAKTLLRLLEKSPLELFPPGSAERRSYISLVHEHLAADDSFSASEFADLVDQEISQLRDGSQTSGVLSASESQMRFLQVSFCAAKGEMVCALNYMEHALAKTISGPRQRGNMQLALAALSSLFSGNTAEVIPARAASIIKKFNELKLLDPTPAPGYEINSLFSRVASQLISGSFIELTPAEAAAITTVIQEELQLLNRPWNFYTPTPAARMNAAMLMRFANESPFGDVVKLDDLIALHELLNHSVASRDIIAAFWHYSMFEERQVRNRKQIFRLETKKAHRQIRAASLFLESVGQGTEANYATRPWSFLHQHLSLFSDHSLEVEAMSFRNDPLQDAKHFPGLSSDIIVSWLDPDDAIIYHSLHGGHLHGLCLRKDDQVSFSEPIDSLQFDLNLKLLKLATSRPGPPNIVSDAQFPVKAARLMYQSLFGGFSKCLSNARNIYWLPSDHLKEFPISSLLVRDTDESENAVPGNGLGGLPWFVKDHAVTLLPSVLSLLTNSNTHGFTRYDLEFAGVGNPVLEGLGATDFAVELATRASGGMLEKLNQLAPLPNTETELLTIAGEFESSQLFLAHDATEINVRNKLNSGVESISFATHGLVSGEIKGVNESALVLTVEGQNDTDNDGLLTASEIADLNLVTKFVSLSACNTAIYQPDYFAEETQGLTNAFLLAGARSVMSSRWPVETIAAERLNTSMFSSVLFRKEQYSEALQAAQLAMIRDESDQARQHPRFWASFVVNGHAFARQHNDGSIFIEDYVESQTNEERGRLRVLTKLRKGPTGDFVYGLSVEPDGQGNFGKRARVVRINSSDLRQETLAAFDDIEYVSDFFVDDGAIGFVGLDEVSDGGNVSTYVVHGEIDLQEKRLALERVATVDDQNLLRLTAFNDFGDLIVVTEQGSESFEIATKKRSGTSFTYNRFRSDGLVGTARWRAGFKPNGLILSKHTRVRDYLGLLDRFGALKNCAQQDFTEIIELNGDMEISHRTVKDGLRVRGLTWENGSWLISGSEMPGCANSDSVATGVVYPFNDGSLGNPLYDRATASSTYVETFEAANARLEVTRRAERFDVGYSGAPQLKPHLTGSVSFDQGQMTRVNRGRRQEVSVAAYYAGYEWSVDLLKSGNDAFFESGLIDSHFLYISGSYGSEGFLIRYDLKSHSEKRPLLGSPLEAG